MKTIKWTGKNASMTITYKAEASSYLDLYNELVTKDIISLVDGDPFIKAEAEKNGLGYDDMFDEDTNEYIYDRLAGQPDWKPLTEEEIHLLISGQNGNAYYQEFEEVDE